MNVKEDIIELCEQLEFSLNIQEQGMELSKKRSVKFVYGEKPANYYLPVMHIGTTSTIPTKIEMAIFAEIFVDNVCVIRESYMPKESENLEIVEEAILRRLLQMIFNCGVMRAYKNLVFIQKFT